MKWKLIHLPSLYLSTCLHNDLKKFKIDTDPIRSFPGSRACLSNIKRSFIGRKERNAIFLRIYLECNLFIFCSKQKYTLIISWRGKVKCKKDVIIDYGLGYKIHYVHIRRWWWDFFIFLQDIKFINSNIRIKFYSTINWMWKRIVSRLPHFISNFWLGFIIKFYISLQNLVVDLQDKVIWSYLNFKKYIISEKWFKHMLAGMGEGEKLYLSHLRK